MYFKKYFISGIFLLTTTQVIAAEEDKNNNIGLNFFFTLGTSLYQNIQISTIEFKDPKSITTTNLQLGALYELNKSDTGSLVVGAALDFSGIYYKGGSKIQGNTNNINLLVSSLGNRGYIGYKLTPSKRFSIYALGDVSYFAYNHGIILVDNSLISEEISIESHYNYGATLMNTFNITDSFAISLILGIHNNSMSLDNSKTIKINEKLNYTDATASLGLVYTIWKKLRFMFKP